MVNPKARPTEVAENERSEKPFNISSMAMRRPPNPKPIRKPKIAALGPAYSARTSATAMPAAEQSRRKKMRMNQSDMVNSLLKYYERCR